MRRSAHHRAIITGLLVASAALAGCDSASYAPPASKRSKAATASGTMPVRAKEIVLVLPSDENVDLAFYEQSARNEVGKLRHVFRAVKPRAGDTKSRQAELIGQAIVDGASAIIIVPDHSKETAEALAAVDQKKTPIVLLGRPLDAPSSGSPYTLVTFPDFKVSAKKLVEAIAQDAKKAGFPADAPVLLLRGQPDESRAARDAAIEEALKAAKIPVAAVVALPPEDMNLAKKEIAEAVKAHPKIAAVITDDDMGISQVAAARGEMTPKGSFLIAGYLPSRVNMTMVALNQASLLFERNADLLARKAALVANDRIEGKTVPDRVEVELNARRASNALNPTPFR